MNIKVGEQPLREDVEAARRDALACAESLLLALTNPGHDSIRRHIAAAKRSADELAARFE
jgi:hypothetical protein